MTEAARQRILRLETQAMFPYLIEVTYFDEYDKPVLERYCNSDSDLIYNGEVYHAAWFNVKPPTHTNTSISDGQLTLSAVDQGWIVKVRQARKRAKCRFVACILYDDDNLVDTIEEIETMTFTLIKANWTETTMSFTMMFDDRMNLSVPLDMANILKVPGLA